MLPPWGVILHRIWLSAARYRYLYVLACVAAPLAGLVAPHAAILGHLHAPLRLQHRAATGGAELNRRCMDLSRIAPLPLGIWAAPPHLSVSSRRAAHAWL